MSDNDSRNFDVVVLGATGFTGKLVVEYLFNTYGTGDSLSWAIAGRNAQKLESVKREILGSAGVDVPIIIADASDQASIDALVARTAVVATTVGPYARYGSGLVKACAEAGTHYCDLTGEVQWMRKMIDEHHVAAEASGARIVHTCGFDSIPSDMGTWFMQRAMFERTNVYASKVKARIGKSRGGMSGGTVDSLVNLVEEAKRDPSIRQLLQDAYSLNPVNTPRGPDGPDQSGAVYDMDFGKWTAPFVMAGINTRVVRRSNALLGFRYGQDFSYDESMLTADGPGGYLAAATVSAVSLVVMASAYFDPTRGLLRRMAPAAGEGPSRSLIETGFFEIEMLAVHPDDPSRNLLGKVTGDRDPGYGATSKMLAESAVCLALDPLDSKGGILTPSAAMGDHLLDRLTSKAGMTFDVVDGD